MGAGLIKSQADLCQRKTFKQTDPTYAYLHKTWKRLVSAHSPENKNKHKFHKQNQQE